LGEIYLVLSIDDQNLLTFLPSILFDRAITLLIPSLMDYQDKLKFLGVIKMGLEIQDALLCFDISF